MLEGIEIFIHHHFVKMLSKRFYTICTLIHKFAYRIGSNNFYFDSELLLLKPVPKDNLKVKRNFALALVWGFAQLLMVVVHFRNHDVDHFTITLAFFMGYLFLFTLFTITCRFSNEEIITFNACLIYIRHVQSKLS